MPAARVEHIGARGADPARLPPLFEGMVAVASTSILHGERPSTSMLGCVRPNARTPHSTLHRLTNEPACCRRLSGLIIHHVQAADSATFITDELHVVRQHFTSTRACCDGAKGSRGAAPMRSTAAAAAARLGTRPQGPCGPAPALPRLLVRVVCFRVVHVGSAGSPPCRAREAMFVMLCVSSSVDLCRY